ncbi:MAG: 30S ribosomal protein S12 methylthiotransferase RimO [Bacteroidetes bacterium HGW-Bacteroidetes-15]|nr:MAG: 30S ribosomal protein S12 methylthiotransferase RimO [Bacteroidetes bacterium HGW-Bacteroidetes-15]
MSEEKKINIVTLGCSKNIVDSEYLMKQLEVGGWQVVYDSNDLSAKIVVVNTCGFIADAKEESIDTIISLVNAKREGLIQKVFVMGCLSQRYRDELEKEIPEVDGFFGVNDLSKILSSLHTDISPQDLNKRLITTPSHYAYLKISEGCSWGCSFCAIPLIRGKHISKPIPELVEQAQYLVNNGVKELILIAQDLTFYGKDIYGSRKLADLLNELSKIKGLEWIRLHYAYPTGFPNDIINIIKDNPKVCKYLDIPFQHISDKMLKIMRRGNNKEETLKLISKIRKEVPNIAIRTTLLVGHPGEEEEDFQQLIDFVKDARFDRLGVFSYSEEENTYSATLPDNIPPEIKQQRVDEIMELQRNISLSNNRNRIGKTYKVIVDRVEEEYYIARSEFDSPEVDQEVLIKRNSSINIQQGDFINCKISEADDYDLYGTIE